MRARCGEHARLVLARSQDEVHGGEEREICERAREDVLVEGRDSNGEHREARRESGEYIWEESLVARGLVGSTGSGESECRRGAIDGNMNMRPRTPRDLESRRVAEKSEFGNVAGLAL